MDKPRKDYEPLDNKPIEFQITDIYIPENDRNKEKDFDEIYSMILYGICNNGATISTTVNCFKPFFYIKSKYVHFKFYKSSESIQVKCQFFSFFNRAVFIAVFNFLTIK